MPKRTLPPTITGGPKARPRPPAPAPADLDRYAYAPGIRVVDDPFGAPSREPTAAPPRPGLGLQAAVGRATAADTSGLVAPRPPRQLPSTIAPPPLRKQPTEKASPPAATEVTATLALLSPTAFSATLSRGHAAAEALLQQQAPDATVRQPQRQGRRYDFALASYEPVLQALTRAPAHWRLSVEQIPRHALAAATAGALQPSAGPADDAALRAKLPAALHDALAPYQRRGVSFLLGRRGRALLADEMGLGKTVQAIAAAAAYSNEWPLLVCCPSTARWHWRDELLRWLPTLLDGDGAVRVVTTTERAGADGRWPPPEARAVVISYDLAARMAALVKAARFGVVICDESQALKSRTAQRTKALLPVLHAARRALLLSGTPALSRPAELFTQLNAIDKETYRTWTAFAMRYCDARRTQYGLDVSGASNLPELHAVLFATVALRRLKADVIGELPPKRREILLVKTPAAGGSLSGLRAALLGGGGIGDGASHVRGLLVQHYQEAARLKLPELLRHVRATVQAERKVVFFAHHQLLLDAVQRELAGVEHVRIDGSVGAEARHTAVSRFQREPRVRAAIVGITVGGTALTLTAAQLVVFLELYWTPGALLQAEDRLHRIGQTGTVRAQYVLGAGTVDELLWPLLQKKARVVGHAMGGSLAAASLPVQQVGEAAAAPVASRFFGGTSGEGGGGEAAAEEEDGAAEGALALLDSLSQEEGVGAEGEEGGGAEAAVEEAAGTSAEADLGLAPQMDLDAWEAWRANSRGVSQ